MPGYFLREGILQYHAEVASCYVLISEQLLEQVKTLLARIAALEAREGQPPKTPDNSSLPRIASLIMLPEN